MSSFSGSPAVDGNPSDPALELAPKGESGPDFGSLVESFQLAVANNAFYSEQTAENFNTRYALWNGQTADGKKHARNDTTEVVPWDGASDLRVFLTDEAICSKVAMQWMAFRRANLTAIPIEGGDLKRSKIVSHFLKWLVHNKIPDLEREVELLSQYIQEKGAGILGCFWESKIEKTQVSLSLEQLQQQFQDIDVMELVNTDSLEDEFLGVIQAGYDITRAKAKKVLKSLRETGQATVPTVGKAKSYPVLRAFNLDTEVFLPDDTNDLETASAIYRVDYFTASQLRAFVHTDNWDEAWVEKAIECGRGKIITPTQGEYNQQFARSFVYQYQQRYTDKIGVVRAYQRLSDEDGIPGIFHTVFSPFVPPDADQKGYAKFGLLGYAHGQMPFVLFRREVLSRKALDTRGIPEPGKPSQDLIKVHRDSLVDAASLAIIPPIMHPIGRPPTRWGPGARVGERRPGEYRFADRPAFDPSTEKSQQLTMDSFNRYCGFVSRDTDPQFAALKNQFETEKFLAYWGKAFKQVFSLYQQFGSEEVAYRVIGLHSDKATTFVKGDPTEDYDFYLSFDVNSLDPEQTFAKIEQIAKYVATADRDGVVDYSELLQIMVESIDPNIAERIIQPKNIGAAKAVTEMQDKLAKVYAGFDQDIDVGTPPQIGISTIQNYVANDPQVQMKMQNPDDPFKSRIEKLMKQLEFQIQQQQNAQIGRLGA